MFVVSRLQFSAVSENRISEVETHAVLIKRDAPRPFLARDVAASVIWVACDRRHDSITFPRVVFWSRHSFPWASSPRGCRLGYFMEIGEGGGRAHKRLGRFKRIRNNGSGNSPQPYQDTRESVPFLLNLKYSALRQNERYVLHKECERVYFLIIHLDNIIILID